MYIIIIIEVVMSKVYVRGKDPVPLWQKQFVVEDAIMLGCDTQAFNL